MESFYSTILPIILIVVDLISFLILLFFEESKYKTTTGFFFVVFVLSAVLSLIYPIFTYGVYKWLFVVIAAIVLFILLGFQDIIRALIRAIKQELT